ncbi:MAG: DUF4442 domain-containing protein [Saprospiraceae bacterium]|nr:DUF4442 domain-containing protein [Saprospiraceae bacterium]
MTKDQFYRLVNSPFRFGLYLLWKLPAAWFMGVSVTSCDREKAVVHLPYGWRSQNPFRSIYFAAQLSAGELSTGVLVLAAISGERPVSMLVTDIKAQFYKKANQPLRFTCEQGLEVNAMIQEVITTGESRQMTLHSTGRLPDGTPASEVWVTWSFKGK